ncbi:MAG: hypothetical protein HYZ42_09155 [Bacteroidetes bacterium]|nr:hypothetical protein [Bacteroidota bacterium]
MQQFLITLMLLGSLLCNSCSHKCQDETNEECENYNPCWDQKPVTAGIDIYWDQYFAPAMEYHDSVYLNSMPLTFNSPIDANSYEWILGAETLSVQKFKRTFKLAPPGMYSVKLKIKKQPNKACFPDDDGEDTKTQNFYIVPSVCQFQTYGHFKVLFEGSTDSTIVSLRGWNYNTGSTADSCYDGLKVINFDQQNDTIDMSGYNDWTNLYIQLYYAGTDGPSDGYFKITNQGTFESEYTINFKRKRFKGRKL